jgi:hypothetical protein
MPGNYLEEAMDFRCRPFQDFLGSSQEGPEMLQRYYEKMAEHEHPYVRFTAGGAAAELAFCAESEDRPVRLAERLGALELARICWQGADFAAEIGAQTTPKARAELTVADFHRRQSLASIPSLQVAALWRAGESSRPGTEELLSSTRIALLGIGKEIANISADHPAFSLKGILASEAALGLVLDQHPHRVVVPASVRRRHYSVREERAALVAMYKDIPEVSMLVQCDTRELQHGAPSRRSPRRATTAYELGFRAQGFLSRVLNDFIARSEGTASKEKRQELARLQLRTSETLDFLREQSMTERPAPE